MTKAQEIAELEDHLKSPGKSKHCTVKERTDGQVEINWEPGWGPREAEARLKVLKGE